MAKQPISETNLAFIDAQNLHYGTMHSKKSSWTIDLERFRVYLQDKYKVEKAYYFLGAYDSFHQKMYQAIQEAGYILIFRAHTKEMKGLKKGNVDTDIVFSVMEQIAEKKTFDKVILVSGDGDYMKMVEYLIKKNKFKKLLAPTQYSLSSLYTRFISNDYYAYLDNVDTRAKIEYRKRKNKA